MDRLFELVKLETGLDTILRYHDVLKGQYASELLDLYVLALEAYGHKTNSRGEYADLVRKIERIIKDVPRGKERVLAVARQLKETYSVKPRRPAMLEELSKLV